MWPLEIDSLEKGMRWHLVWSQKDMNNENGEFFFDNLFDIFASLNAEEEAAACVCVCLREVISQIEDFS